MIQLFLLFPFFLFACAGARPLAVDTGKRGLISERPSRAPVFASKQARTAAATGTEEEEWDASEGPGVCAPLSPSDRERVLAIAEPRNFPATKYKRGPNFRRPVEKETDCSRFVYEVYLRAGLPFSYRPSRGLSSAREFEMLPESAAQPGDLMLFRGHVGIVDKDGKIISAMLNRRHRRPSSIGKVDRKHFTSFRGKRYVLRYRCRPSALSHAVAGHSRDSYSSTP